MAYMSGQMNFKHAVTKPKYFFAEAEPPTCRANAHVRSKKRGTRPSFHTGDLCEKRFFLDKHLDTQYKKMDEL